MTMQAKASPTSMRELMQSDADRAREIEIRKIREQQEREDAARLAGGNTVVVAITSFTIRDDAHPDGRLVRSGEELEIPTFDVASWSGRVVPKAMFNGNLAQR